MPSHSWSTRSAPGIEVVALAAALGGVGGSLFWVALRADVGARLDDDPVAYARLLSSEQAGAIAAFVAGLTLLGWFGYRPLFALGAAACAAASALLMLERRATPVIAVAGDQQPGGLRRAGARLTPFLALTALTAGAESALALLLLLHLQARFDLEPQEIALLFLPGAIVLTVLPERAYTLALRIGRARAMVASLVASALFTLALALVGTPAVVAVLWTLCAACIALALPVEQATVAQASRGRLGRGIGLYQTAALLGTIVAAPVLAGLYGELGWRTACLVIAGALLVGAALVPIALAWLGLPDRLTS